MVKQDPNSVRQLPQMATILGAALTHTVVSRLAVEHSHHTRICGNLPAIIRQAVNSFVWHVLHGVPLALLNRPLAPLRVSMPCTSPTYGCPRQSGRLALEMSITPPNMYHDRGIYCVNGGNILFTVTLRDSERIRSCYADVSAAIDFRLAIELPLWPWGSDH
jgi:hypothetical protein